VQTAAAAALTAYDPPTRTEATADKAEVIAALGDITIDVGDITATVDLTPVTAALEPIEAALAGLGAGAVTVVSPVTEDGEVIVYAGDDYSAEHGREIEFTVSDAAHALELDTATVYLKVREATWTATTVTSTTTGYIVVFEPTRTETAALATIRQDFELEAELADGDVVTLATGSLTTKPDIPAVSS
jgi:hypothetical protein